MEGVCLIIRQYLNELSNTRLLEPDEERELWKRYTLAGCHDSRQHIIESYQPLVYKIASRLTESEDLFFDLIQEGTVGLIESVERFDYTKDVKFSTFATLRVRGRMINYLRKNSAAQNVLTIAVYQEEVQEFWDMTVDENVNVAEEVAARSIYSQLEKAVSRLNDKEQKVIKDMYVYDKDPLTSAFEMNISTSYYYKLQKKALQRLRGMLSKLRAEIKLTS